MKICRNKCTKYNFFLNGRATCLDDFTWNDPPIDQSLIVGMFLVITFFSAPNIKELTGFISPVFKRILYL
jgi:hypothetical protein